MVGLPTRKVIRDANLMYRNECALPGQKHLDMDSFVKGMWRIEEELRRLQGNQSTSTSHPYSSRRTTIELLH